MLLTENRESDDPALDFLDEEDDEAAWRLFDRPALIGRAPARDRPTTRPVGSQELTVDALADEAEGR